MQIRNVGFVRKVFGVLLAGATLVALSGCYPYYWDYDHDHGHRHYDRGYHHGDHDRDDRWRHHRGYRRY